MNRGERRAQWLARHRGVSPAGNVPSAPHAGVALPAPRVPVPRLPHVEPAPRLPREAPAASVRLHIAEVVFHGFDARQRYTLLDAVRQELTQLLAERGVPASLRAAKEVERIDAGSFGLVRGGRAGLLGARLARAVYGGLER